MESQNPRRTPRAGTVSIAELLIGIALTILLLAIAVLSQNWAAQLAIARDTQRRAHVNAILNGIRQNIIDNRTGFVCVSGPLPTSTRRMSSVASTTTYNIAPCLVPIYLPRLPYDPKATGAHYTSTTDYDTGYTVYYNASSGQTTVAAPYAEKATTSVTR